jgi:hypothetical protein
MAQDGKCKIYDSTRRKFDSVRRCCSAATRRVSALSRMRKRTWAEQKILALLYVAHPRAIGDSVYNSRWCQPSGQLIDDRPGKRDSLQLKSAASRAAGASCRYQQSLPSTRVVTNGAVGSTGGERARRGNYDATACPLHI